MSATIAKQTPTEVTLEIKLDESNFKSAVDFTFDKLRGQVKAAGFRPGKAPNYIVERELGVNTVQSEVLEAALQRSYAEAVREHDLTVIGPPEIKIGSFVPYSQLEYSATAPLLPPVKVADLKTLNVKRETPNVEPAEVEAVVADLRRRQAKRIEVKRGAKSGDEVTIDFTGSKDGKLVSGAAATDHKLILGSGNFIPGFEENLTGLKPGEQKTFELTFPKDYQAADLAGQAVKFEAILKVVNELDLPALDGAFAKSIGPFESIDQLKNDIAGQLKLEKQTASARQFEDAVIAQLLEKSQYQIPEPLIETQLGRLRHEFDDSLAGRGLDLAKYLQMSNQNEEALIKSWRPEAERRVALALILTEIAKRDQISVSPQELDDEIKRLKQQYTNEELQKELAGPKAREDVYNHLLASRVVKRVIEQVDAN